MVGKIRKKQILAKNWQKCGKGPQAKKSAFVSPHVFNGIALSETDC